MFNIAANISVLFREQPLLTRFQLARTAGFDGVEMQFPYDEKARALASAAQSADIPVILINAPVYPNIYPLGITGRPAMRDLFRAQIPLISEYASILNVKFVHFLAGTESAPSERERCHEIYIDNLRYAAAVLGESGIEVLIEPLNPYDAPGYLLGTLEETQKILDRCGGEVGLQFDVYHIARMGHDPAAELQRMLPLVRHIQFADVPGRHEPGTGKVAFELILGVLAASHYRGWLSAEYLPLCGTAASLQWLNSWRSLLHKPSRR